MVLWFVGLLLALAGTALSPWGSQWLFEQAQSRGWVQAERFAGAPLDALTLEGFTLTAGTLDVSIDYLHLAWADDCLLSGRLCLDDFTVEGARVRGGESASEPPPAAAEADSGGGLPAFSVPLPIEIRRVRLNDVGIQLANGTDLHWAHFETGATLSGSRVSLKPTTLAETRVTLPASEEDHRSLGDTLASLEPGPGVVSSAAIESARTLHEDASRRDPAAVSADNEGAASMTSAVVADGGLDGPLTPLTLAAAANVSGASASAEKPPLAGVIERQLRVLQEQLPDFTLPIEVEIPSLVISDARLDGPSPQRLDHLELAAYAIDHKVEIRRLRLRSPEADADLRAEADLTGDFPLSLRLDARLKRTPIYGQTVSLDIDGDLTDLDVALQTSGNAEASLDAHLNLMAETLPFSLALQGRALRWPLASRDFAPFTDLAEGLDESAILVARQLHGIALETDGDSAPYRLDRLSLRAEGDLSGYQANLELAGQGPELPPVTLSLAGRGDLAQFHWQPLDVASQNGTLASTGTVRWTPTLSASVDLNLSRLPLQAFTQAVSGQLNGQARLAFAMAPEGGWQLALPTLAIDGQLQQRPLRLNAALDGNSQMQWNIRRLDLRQGNNRLTASGRLDERIQLDGRVDAPNLASILPQLAGTLQGAFHGRGTLERPQIDLQLQGDNVAFAQNQLQRLTLSAQSAGTQDPTFEVDLDADGVEAGGQRLESLALDLSGRLSQHQLSLALIGGEGLPVSRASLELQGGLNLDSQRYRGHLAPLAVSTDYGDLALREALDFTANLATASATVEPFCLDRRQGGALCLTERMNASADQGRAALSLEEVPMALLDAFLPQGWQADGRTDGRLIASWSRGGQAWAAAADIDSQVAVSGVDARGAAWQVPEAALSLSLEANQRQVQTQLELSLQDAGRLRLQAQVDDPAGAGTLQGRLQLENLRFSPYRPLVAGIDQLEGALDGDVALGGNLAMPSLDGNVEIRDVRVRGGVSPVAITDARLQMALRGQTSTLEGHVQSDDGRLELDGDADWSDPANWRANASIDGQESPLLIALPAYGRLRVAPDIQIQALPQRLRVRGDVNVPWARLDIGQLPASAQAPSSDTVIISEEEDRQQRAAAAAEANDQGADTAQALADAGMQLDVLVDLHLGPDMQLEAYGLEAGLQGELQVRQGTGPVQLFGDVNLVDGTYTSFGQDLIIRQGQVLFSGPASQPSLRFEAIRNPDTTEDDVIAGLRVTGQASAPRLTIFSEPAMTESRALSYILRGRAPEDSGSGDDALTSALIGLSLSQTGSAVGQVGEVFGVEDLSLDASGAGDDSQVVVSGYVFDDLKVSYGVGIFSPIAELTLRYRLIQNLYLQAVSGAAQALDLIYTFSLGRSGP
uniref:autotransporter assembly complex protein TamB n=1 Tax=Salinicola avicenniae TaxID=2916836 RepID=UPI0020741456|nr:MULTISPECIES: translocation/assembly module TamB domain-containing protein [unclassified Salinicola]